MARKGYHDNGEPIVYTRATLAEVAEQFEVSLATVNYWRASGMPGEPGNWHLPTIQEWLTARRQSKDHRGRLPRANGDWL